MTTTFQDESQFIRLIENVKLIDRINTQAKIIGILYLTSKHLVFISTTSKIELWIYYSWIGSVDKQPINTNGSPLTIKCKNFLNVSLIIQKERDCQSLFTTLLEKSKPAKFEELCCFLTNHHLSYLKDSQIYKHKFDLEAEYARMGLPNKEWQASTINKTYQICDTYPNIFYVPTSASTPILQASASFRSRGRLPALSYLHHNGASLIRCSQPLAGFSARCVEDEQLLDCILKTNKKSSFMYIVDTRPKINAIANRAQGKGYENEANYANIQFYFFGIENIHVMRSSLQKLLEVCDIPNPTTSQFLSGLDKSDWLKHIKIILETATFMMDAIHEQCINVVVHCSDGWDRTAQTCALSTILLDPYYRTIHGYQILIEKEWLMFGHKFSERCAHIDVDSKEASPIFTQFLDCTWQLMQQYPCAFEFNELYLIHLHDHVYSCQFGTFVGNCQKDRIDLRIEERTYSLFDFMQLNIQTYYNPLYKANSQYSREVLRPDTRLQALNLWKGMYKRFDRSIHPKENYNDIVSIVKEHIISLEDHVKILEKRSEELKNLVGKKKTSMEEEASVDRVTSELTSKLSLNQLAFELNSISTDWKSIRNTVNCTCSSTFDSINKKKNCWKCGEIYCNRCVNSYITLPGHSSSGFISLCSNCQLILKNSPSPYINLNCLSHSQSIEQSLYAYNAQHSINNSDFSNNNNNN